MEFRITGNQLGRSTREGNEHAKQRLNIVLTAGVFVAKEFGKVEFAIDDLFNIDLVDPWPTLCNIGKGEGIITKSRSMSCWYWYWWGTGAGMGLGEGVGTTSSSMRLREVVTEEAREERRDRRRED